MKKNYLFGLTAMAAMMMFTSCSEEELVKQPQAGELAQVSINVNTPELGAATRAFGDGTTAKRLHYAVYNVKGEGENRTRTYLEELTVDGTQELKELKTTVDLQLVTGNTYDVIFWADADEQDQLYTLDWKTVDNPTVTINYDNITCNNEGYDAFYGKITFKVEGAQTETVKLKRPFAQLNIGTNDIDEATNAGYQLAKTEVEVETYETLHLWEKGKDINVAEAVSGKRTVTFASSAIPSDEVFPVSGYEYMAMNYLLRPADKELTDVMFRFYSTEDELKERTYASVPLQRNWRTNIYGQLITSDVDVNVEIVPGFGNDGEEDFANVVYVSTAEQLLNALASTKKEIVKVVMLNDITLNGGTSAYSTEAKEVIIEGNQTSATRNANNGKKPTLTFKDSYRTYIKLANPDGKITFNNVNINRETTGGTHWHDNNMKFCSNAEFNNVAFNKGICLDNAKTFVLNNCSINKGKVATYGMFITAGCNVTIDGLSITHSEGVAGRGIKIVDEDVADKDALTTLSVSNATFVTEAKAAILVGSQGGADITLANINLAGVKADGFNAVWVDEDYKNYASNVTVVGGFQIVEGTAADSNPFLEEGETVNIPAGTYKFPAKVASGVTIDCAEGTVFEGASSLNINGATVVGAKFSNPKGTVVTQTINGTFQNCTFEGSNALRYCYAGETVVFENCVFDGVVYGVHFDGGENDVTFRGCTFSGFNAFGAALTQLTIEDCVFQANGKSGYNGANLWGTTNIIGTKFIFDGAASTEWIGLNAANSNKTITLTDCVLEGTDKSMFTYFANYKNGDKVTVDGVEYNLADETIENKEGVTYEGKYFENPINDALYFNNWWMESDATIKVTNKTYGAIILENVKGNLSEDAIFIDNDNNSVMVLDNCEFTLAEGKKLIKSTKTIYQVFMANIIVNGVKLTNENAAQYLENVGWFQIVDEI